MMRPWQVIVASILANGYIGLGYGALPALIVSEVDAGETGVATSMNAIAGRSEAPRPPRWSRFCSAVRPRAFVPAENSFVAIFLGGAATAALAMVLIAMTRPQANVASNRLRRDTNPVP